MTRANNNLALPPYPSLYSVRTKVTCYPVRSNFKNTVYNTFFVHFPKLVLYLMKSQN